jgi:membrane protein insertase Oxa1/YidC/SpoIIIJ
MVSSYARERGYGYLARKNWPITLVSAVVLSFGSFSVFALALGFPEVAGIVAAYSIIVVLVVVLFVILPVYALDMLD